MLCENVTSAENQQERHLSNIYLNESSETTRQIPLMDYQLATLIGLLFTDGCVSPRGKSYRIYFGVTSKALTLIFRDCIQSVFNLPSSKIRLTKRNEFYVAVVDSKEIGNYLVHRFGTFRTLKYDSGETSAKLPVEELISSGCVPYFLRAAFSCDGGLCLYPVKTMRGKKVVNWLNRNVFLACSHKRLRDDFMILINHLGIKATNSITDKKIKISSKSEIIRFARQIGFLHGVEVTNHSLIWRKCTKVQVLSEMISSYKR